MTIREKLEIDFIDLGLPLDEAKIVMNEFETFLTPMKDRWDTDITAYPPTVLAALRKSAEHRALIWIEANRPEYVLRILI